MSLLGFYCYWVRACTDALGGDGRYIKLIWHTCNFHAKGIHVIFCVKQLAVDLPLFWEGGCCRYYCPCKAFFFLTFQAENHTWTADYSPKKAAVSLNPHHALSSDKKPGENHGFISLVWFLDLSGYRCWALSERLAYNTSLKNTKRFLATVLGKALSFPACHLQRLTSACGGDL